MPKLKPSATELMDREIRAAILAGQERRAMDSKTTAKYLNMCKETFLRKNREPKDFTIENLRVLVRIFRITDDEILRMIRGEKA